MSSQSGSESDTVAEQEAIASGRGKRLPRPSLKVREQHHPSSTLKSASKSASARRMPNSMMLINNPLARIHIRTVYMVLLHGTH